MLIYIYIYIKKNKSIYIYMCVRDILCINTRVYITLGT